MQNWLVCFLYEAELISFASGSNWKSCVSDLNSAPRDPVALGTSIVLLGRPPGLAEVVPGQNALMFEIPAPSERVSVQR